MPLLKYKKVSETLILKFSDEKTQNSFSPLMADELNQVIKDQKFNSLLLTNSGSSFCSGGNLRYYKQLQSKEEGLEANRKISEILDKVFHLPVPKACFVNGTCLGGGIELISCFDYVIASPQTSFGLWQRRVGLSFGWGGQARLQERLGVKQLENWLIGAETISAYTAKKWGLINQIKLLSVGLRTCQDWIDQCLGFGQQSLNEILKNKQDQPRVFQKLWLAEKHTEVLKKFK